MNLIHDFQIVRDVVHQQTDIQTDRHTQAKNNLRLTSLADVKMNLVYTPRLSWQMHLVNCHGSKVMSVYATRKKIGSHLGYIKMKKTSNYKNNIGNGLSTIKLLFFNMSYYTLF